MNDRNHHGETKRESQRKAKRCTACRNPKKKERASPSHGKTIKGTIHVRGRLYKKWEISVV